MKALKSLFILTLPFMLSACYAFVSPTETKGNDDWIKIIENNEQELFVKSMNNESSFKAVLNELTAQEIITYVSPDTKIPLSIYDEYMNESPQLIYTTLQEYDGVIYASSKADLDDNERTLYDGNEEITVYRTLSPLEELPFIEGEYYLMEHSPLEKEILKDSQ